MNRNKPERIEGRPEGETDQTAGAARTSTALAAKLSAITDTDVRRIFGCALRVVRQADDAHDAVSMAQTQYLQLTYVPYDAVGWLIARVRLEGMNILRSRRKSTNSGADGVSPAMSNGRIARLILEDILEGQNDSVKLILRTVIGHDCDVKASAASLGMRRGDIYTLFARLRAVYGESYRRLPKDAPASRGSRSYGRGCRSITALISIPVSDTICVCKYCIH